MSTIAQGTLYRFREGGFPEIPHLPLALTEQSDCLEQFEDLFTTTETLDQGPRDKNNQPGVVELEVESSQSQVNAHEKRTWKGDILNGEINACEDSWSLSDCDLDHARTREVHFNSNCVDSIEITENPGGVAVHVWHLNREHPGLSYQQAW